MKTCDNCGKTRSEEWSLSLEFAKSNRRIFWIWLLTAAILVLSLILNFILIKYITEFEFVDESVIVDSHDGGNANYIGNDGDIYNGTGYCQTADAP